MTEMLRSSQYKEPKKYYIITLYFWQQEESFQRLFRSNMGIFTISLVTICRLALFAWQSCNVIIDLQSDSDLHAQLLQYVLKQENVIDKHHKANIIIDNVLEVVCEKCTLKSGQFKHNFIQYVTTYNVSCMRIVPAIELCSTVISSDCVAQNLRALCFINFLNTFH